MILIMTRSDQAILEAICTGKYVVDASGVIYNGKTRRALKPARLPSGYQIVTILLADGSKLSVFLHRLVAFAYCPIPSADNVEVNHKDGNKDNNCADNLEWVSRQGNYDHAVRVGLRRPGGHKHIDRIIKAKVIALLAAAKTPSQVLKEINCPNLSLAAIYKIKSRLKS